MHAYLAARGPDAYAVLPRWFALVVFAAGLRPFLTDIAERRAWVRISGTLLIGAPPKGKPETAQGRARGRPEAVGGVGRTTSQPWISLMRTEMMQRQGRRGGEGDGRMAGQADGGTRDSSTRNSVRGGTHGAVVQAGVVHGDVRIEAARAGERPPPPWQLPPAGRVVDRVSELAILDRHRQRALPEQRPVVVALSGLGGVGKTATALAWLHRLREDLPDGQLYAALGGHAPDGPTDPGEVLGGFVRALGVPHDAVPVSLAERATLYRSLTAGRHLAVLLDDAVSAAQVRPLLPGGTGVAVVTARRRLTGLVVDGAVALDLDPLPSDAALELLGLVLGDGRVAAQPDDARALVELCAGLPLAVRVAGAQLAARPRRRLGAMVRSLTDAHRRLGLLTVAGDDGSKDVRAALSLAYEALPSGAARLYRLLGLHPGTEFAAPAAAAALGAREVRDVHAALEALYDTHLLVGAAHGDDDRYRMHDLVRLHAHECAERDETAPERAAALRRIADHYLATATRAEEVADPQHRTMRRDYGPGPLPTFDRDDFEGPEQALDWLELELPNLMAVVRSARRHGFPTVAWQLTDAMWPLFLRRKMHDSAHHAYGEGLAAARELRDAKAECRMLTSGGLGELGRGRADHALEMFERAAAIFRGQRDALGRGLAHRRLGHLDEAGGLFAEAAERLPACGDVRAGALARLNLADVALARALPEQAVVDAEAAGAVLREAGDAYNAARAELVASKAQLMARRLIAAQERLSVAGDLLRGMGAHYETARALECLAELAELRGDSATAAQRCQEALALFDVAGRPDAPEARAARARLERVGEPPAP
ncbi:ATP-binding protein [Streptomyces sp. BYX5S]